MFRFVLILRIFMLTVIIVGDFYFCRSYSPCRRQRKLAWGVRETEKGLCDSNHSRVVGIATGYGLDDRGVGFRVQVGSRIFSSPRRLDRHWAQPSSYPMGIGDPFPGDKAAGS
jgi:hypothetical protein